MKIQTKFKETEIKMIPKDWEVKRIGDTCSIIKEQFIPNHEDIRNYIGLEHIEQGSLRLIGIGISSNVESNKFVFKKGQILFGKLRPYFRKVYRPDFDGVCSTDILVIDRKRGFDNGYLFYFFANPIIIDEATRSSEGTKMPRASWGFISRLERSYPELKEQKRIAKFLSDLDSKIELNQKINRALEAIGQALFKSWFIDFEFPNEKGKAYQSSGGEMVDSELGKIPKGWKVEELPKVAEVIDCLHTMKPERKKEGKLMLQLYNIADNGTINLDDKYFVSDHDYLEWKKNIEVKEGDCLVTNAGKAGAIGQVPFYIIAAIGRNITAIRPLSITPSYLFNYLKSDYGKKEIERNTDTGTIFNSLNVKGIKKIKIVIPEKAVLDIFENIARKLRIKNEINILENQILATSRDSLLPKLMSGQIRIPIEARG